MWHDEICPSISVKYVKTLIYEYDICLIAFSLMSSSNIVTKKNSDDLGITSFSQRSFFPEIPKESFPENIFPDAFSPKK